MSRTRPSEPKGKLGRRRREDNWGESPCEAEAEASAAAWAFESDDSGESCKSCGRAKATAANVENRIWKVKVF